MENRYFREELTSYIRSERKRTAIESNRLKGAGKRDINGLEMKELREEAANRMGNILWRVMAIELLSRNKGGTTPGVDDKKFEAVMGEAKDKEKASKQLSKRQE